MNMDGTMPDLTGNGLVGVKEELDKQGNGAGSPNGGANAIG